VVVGADRIAANGDTANKIGTTVSLVAKAHDILSLHLSTIDFELPTGSKIQISVIHLEIYQVGDTIAPAEVEFYNPAFDVTPSALITAIVTEHGAFAPGELNQFQAKQVV